jgi:hypothetical protein
MLTLEDQLLQNRISTDTNLSNTYQNHLRNRADGLANQWNVNTTNDANLSNAYQRTLQARAEGLASQWNQNTTNENSLTGNRLKFLEDIQDEGPSFNDVANYRLQAAAAMPDNLAAEAKLKAESDVITNRARQRQKSFRSAGFFM